MNQSEGKNHSPAHASSNYMFYLVFGALGVVYGDIGTSPLYALRECFSTGLTVNPESVLGVLSLIFWSLIIVVTVKYLLYVMKADNNGEGGVLALMALAHPGQIGQHSPISKKIIVWLGLFGAALLYGDGMITPAISVLSAVEGLELVAPALHSYILPITVLILTGLFAVQSQGTGKIGIIFGPIIFCWFFILGVLGVRGLLMNPEVIKALNPYYAIVFSFQHGIAVLHVLGGVFLVVTGGEALYADMGHFGLKPIKIGWFAVVLPGLMLNYLGQGAILLSNPSAIRNPFYLLVPEWGLIPMVILATLATVIASQALISGAFSITRQAVQLGYMPRMPILHTSSKEIGQIYVGIVNFFLFICTVWLVFAFQTSSKLAAAYGIAVSMTMVITTLLMTCVSYSVWGMRKRWLMPLTLLFIFFDGIFVFANFSKIEHGGWFPLTVGAIVFIFMSTWNAGRQILAERWRKSLLSTSKFVSACEIKPPLKVPGTAVFLCRSVEGVPPALLHHLKHNKALHENVVFLMVVTKDIPHVEDSERIEFSKLADGFYRLVAYYGFMESPDLEKVFANSKLPDFEINIEKATFFIGRESIFANNEPAMMKWREELFAFMALNAQRPAEYFNVPRNRVVEIGMQIGM